MGTDYKYLVGIRCFTYNQSAYIPDALNGFVSQQTTFPFVIMVVDDASTDGEQDVIKSFITDNFDSSTTKDESRDYADITFAQHKTNKNCYIVAMFLHQNLYRKGENAKKLDYLSEWRNCCKYESICEGDDFWCHPYKLAEQVNYMETHPEAGLCYTPAKADNNGRNYTKGSEYRGYGHLLQNNMIPTLTVLYRTELFDRYYTEIKPEQYNWKMGDYPIWLWIAAKTDIGYIDKITATYRVLQESASHSTDIDKTISFIESKRSISIFFNNLFNHANKKIAAKINDKSYWKMFETYLMAYRLENAIELYNSHCKQFTLAHKARGFVLLHFSNYRKKSCERWRMRKI